MQMVTAEQGSHPGSSGQAQATMVEEAGGSEMAAATAAVEVGSRCGSGDSGELLQTRTISDVEARQSRVSAFSAQETFYFLRI